MINLLLGQPGGGKSYEAVAYHVIKAIQEGRKVITNLPLNLDYFEKVYPNSVGLIQIIENRGVIRAFSTIEFYGDPWRHPETGLGPLYVIDECHFCLRRGKTPQDVEEWFSMHRHELADVLLMTQSYGKVDKNIIDLVQLCYRVKKATAFGFNTKYIRKVQDGIRGEVMNTEMRTYEKHIYPFYKSHTLSSGSATEAVASDVKPFWSSWTVRIAVLFLFIGVPFSVYTFKNMITPKEPKIIKPAFSSEKNTDLLISQPRLIKSSAGVKTEEQIKIDQLKLSQLQSRIDSEKRKRKKAEAAESHPYTGLQIHLQGVMHWAKTGVKVAHLVVSQNATVVFTLTDNDLILAGYEFELKNDCLGILKYGDYIKAITCNAPSHGVKSSKQIMTRES